MLGGLMSSLLLDGFVDFISWVIVVQLKWCDCHLDEAFLYVMGLGKNKILGIINFFKNKKK